MALTAVAIVSSVADALAGGAAVSTALFHPGSHGDLLIVDLTCREAGATGVGRTVTVSWTGSAGAAYALSLVASINAGTIYTIQARWQALVPINPSTGAIVFGVNTEVNRLKYIVSRVTNGPNIGAQHATEHEVNSTPAISLASAPAATSLVHAAITTINRSSAIGAGPGFTQLAQPDDGVTLSQFQAQFDAPSAPSQVSSWSGGQNAAAGNTMIISEIPELTPVTNVVSLVDGVLFDDTDARTQEKVFTDPVVF